MVAEVGFFIALPGRIVVCLRLRLLGSAYSLLCGVSLRENTTPWWFRLLAHDLRVCLTNALRLLALLRCPKKSAGFRYSLIFSTAATRSPRCIRHRRRSDRSPVSLRSSVSNPEPRGASPVSVAKEQGSPFGLPCSFVLCFLDGCHSEIAARTHLRNRSKSLFFRNGEYVFPYAKLARV